MLKRREEERLRKRQQLILRGQKVTKIQSIARAFSKEFLAMYMAKYNEQRRNASIKIQSMYRRHNAEKKLQALKQERDNKASIVQCFQRRISAMRKWMVRLSTWSI